MEILKSIVSAHGELGVGFVDIVVSLSLIAKQLERDTLHFH